MGGTSVDIDFGTIPLLDRSGSMVGEVRVDLDDLEWLARWSWRLHSGGYAFRGRKIGGRSGRYFTILMHRMILDVPHGFDVEVDHINGDRLDNRRSNLRLVTHGQNMQNRHVDGNRGVKSFKGKWQARATLDRVTHHLGTFDTEAEAAAAAAEWRRQNMPFSPEAST